MNRNILGTRITELIGGTKVKAALFYTFNFDPEFFENYILTKLIHDSEFTDNKLQNSILWRRYMGEGKVPPIAVYYDEKVKSIDYAPQLDYKTFGIFKKGSHFHAKNSFILTSDNRLIVVTGSNNISASGWNINLEVISIFVLKSREFFPQELKNQIWEYIDQVASIYSTQDSFESEAEDLIVQFLKQRKFAGKAIPFYWQINAINGFEKFIKFHIPEDEEVYKIEVISPFYSLGVNLISTLNNNFPDAEINCLIPNQQEDYVELEKKTFDMYVTAGIKWCTWKNQTNKRRYHCKIYRFYTDKKVYMITGSVNFTEKAWGSSNSGINIECAVFNEDSEVDSWLIPISNNYKYKFIGEKNSDENNNEVLNKKHYDLNFSIDWQNCELECFNKEEKTFYLLLPSKVLKQLKKKNKVTIKLDDNELNKYSENSIVRVVDSKSDNSNSFYYYPRHENIGYKPLSRKYKFTDNEILGIWNSLGHKKNPGIAATLDKIMEHYASEEGEIDENKLNQAKNTLSIMSLHLSALLNLEKELFQSKKKLAQNIYYYLLEENLDTLPFYIKNLKENIANEKINPGFCWLLLNTINKYFYNIKRIKTMLMVDQDKITEIESYHTQIVQFIKKLEKEYLTDIENQKKFLQWARKNV